ncbi:MAG: hypothetical protein P1R58_07130 [bacterium]|nr:hypothetical protein [bacterium]
MRISRESSSFHLKAIASLLMIGTALFLPGSSSNAASEPDWGIRYALQAKINGPALTASGDLELWLTNRSDIPIDSILISNGDRRLHLDSILWHGSPLDSLTFEQIEGAIAVPLPQSVQAGQTESFLIRFNSDCLADEVSETGGLAVLTDWFPSLVHRQEYCKREEQRMERLAAKIAAVIEIESEFDLIAPGELLNEKAHYGLLDKREGEVSVDISGQADGVNKALVPPPPVDRPTKRYYLRSSRTLGFDLAIARRLSVDLLVHPAGQTMIGYDPSKKPVWIDLLADRILELQTAMDKFLPGDSAARYLLVGAPGEQQLITGKELLWVDPEPVIKSIALYPIAFNLARVRLEKTSAAESRNNPLLLNGTAYYIAFSILYDLFGNDYLELESRPSIDRTVADELDLTCYRYGIYKLVPSQLELMRLQMGDSLFWSEFRSVIGQFHSGWSDPNEWISVLDSALLSQANLAVKSATVELTETGANVELTIHSGERWQPFVDLCFFGSDGEKEIVRYSHRKLWSHAPRAKINQSLSFVPHSLLIDPDGLLPDRDRSDNYFRLSDEAPTESPVVQSGFPFIREAK